MENRSVLGRDVLGYAISKLVPGAISLVSVAVFTRLIGAAEYGAYALIFSLSAVVSSLGSGWLCQGILRYYSHPGFSQESIGAAISRVTLICVAFSMLLASIIGMITPGMQGAIPILMSAVLAGLTVHYSVQLSVLQAAMYSGRVAWREVIRAVASFTAAIALVLWSGGGYVALTIGVCVGYGVAVLYRAGPSGKTTGERLPARQIGLEMLRYGLPMSLWLGGTLLLPFLDRLLVTRFLGLSQTGFYAASYDIIVRGYSVCLLPITLAVHARSMAEFNRGARASALSLIWRGLRWQSLIFVATLILIALVGPLALQYALGSSTRASLGFVLPLAAGGFLWQLSLLAHKPLELVNRTKWMLCCMLIAIGVSVTFNFAMLPRLGLQAAGYATLLSASTYITLCGLAYLYLRKRTKVFSEDDAGGLREVSSA